ncbi:hypothetical protein [Agrobacterium sp. El2ro-1b]|uniref:hypothetical protein n=1 Tax=Agrobacterium sp. El2ro-1b TaxID=2969528 RepID=UPI003AB0F41D
MPQLFFSDLSAVHGSVTIDGVKHELEADEIATAQNIGLVEGMSFILSRDEGYDQNLNRFLRSCPTMGVRSLNSLRTYARDIVVWMRFLEERRGRQARVGRDPGRHCRFQSSPAPIQAAVPHFGFLLEPNDYGSRQALPMGRR